MSKEAYISYLKDSLGLEHVLLPERSPSSEVAAASTPLLSCYLVSAEGALSAEETALFEKMIAAMKLTMADITTVVTDHLESPFTAPLCVVFTSQPSGQAYGEWSAMGASQIVHTHALKDLLENPSLKKSAWTHLQSVMEKYSHLHH